MTSSRGAGKIETAASLAQVSGVGSKDLFIQATAQGDPSWQQWDAGNRVAVGDLGPAAWLLPAAVAAAVPAVQV